MFTVSNAGENSGETFKLSSDVGAYIFVLLKIFSFIRASKCNTNQLLSFPLYSMTVF